MILLIIAFILILSAMGDWADAKDFECSESNAERRHNELMEIEERRCELISSQKKRKATRRRLARDEHGRFVAEEIILEEEGN
jgi:hypothetical protein